MPHQDLVQAPEQHGARAAPSRRASSSRPARPPRRRPPAQSVIFEGPGGRVPLTRWTLRSDPRNRGLALGWRSGGTSAGTTVSLPNVVEPDALQRAGRRGQLRRLGGLVPDDLPGADGRASTRSASSRPTTWRRCGSTGSSWAPTAAPTFRSKSARTLAAGRHTVVVRVDWRDPARAGAEKAFTAPGSTGAASTARSTCARSARASSPQPTISDDALAGRPRTRRRRTVTVSVEVHNDGPQRARSRPTGSLAHGAPDRSP